MHLIQANCTIEYIGRGRTHAPRGTRLIIVKSDNTVLIHQDKNVKPVNYMPTAISIEIEHIDEYPHLIAKSKTETIDVTIYEILYEHNLDIDDTETLERHGTETDIQEQLATSDVFANTFDDNWRFLTREYETGKGRVDLLAIDECDNQVVLIEVKRIAKRSDVFQLLRYQSALLEHASDNGYFVTTAQKNAFKLHSDNVKQPHMVLVANRFRPRVEEEASKLNIECVKFNTSCSRRDK